MASAEQIQFVDVGEGVNPANVDYDQLGKNLWIYMMSFYPNGPKPKWDAQILTSLFGVACELIRQDPVVPNVASPAVVFGGVYGEGDSLVTLISLAGRPPDVNYVFLGCYLGAGFAPLECLAFVLCMKIVYPHKVFLLKGHHEESIAIELLKVKDVLLARGLLKTEADEIIEMMKRCCSMMSPMATINTSILCIPGGPGPCLQKSGVQAVRGVRKPPSKLLEKKIFMECAWSVMILNEAHRDMNGMPSFTCEEAQKFCEKNGIECMIRGRQLVDEGYLNKPRNVITLVSAVAYLDNFRNQAAVLKIVDDKISVIRYKMEEGEQLSLELVKPGMGRNAVC